MNRFADIRRQLLFGALALGLPALVMILSKQAVAAESLFATPANTNSAAIYASGNHPDPLASDMAVLGAAASAISSVPPIAPAIISGSSPHVAAETNTAAPSQSSSDLFHIPTSMGVSPTATSSVGATGDSNTSIASPAVSTTTPSSASVKSTTVGSTSIPNPSQSSSAPLTENAKLSATNVTSTPVSAAKNTPSNPATQSTAMTSGTTLVSSATKPVAISAAPMQAGNARIAKPLPVDEPPNLDQPADKMAASAPPPVEPSENVTLNLINRLVQRGILTKEDAGDLIKQAKDDAQLAAQQAAVTQQVAQQAAAAQQMATEAAAPPSSDEAVSVSYVPEIVKAEMRDEIKRDVIAAAQSEGWATPNYPSWINNFRPFMDFRFRYEGDYYPTNNSTDPLQTLNFNAINTGPPINISQANGNQSPPIGYPTLNQNENRDRLRIRFRFGADVNLGENFTSGFRLGTGQNGSAVTESQTLGYTGNYGQQGGNFNNYAIWLDRAFLKYELGSDPDKLLAITCGRFDNPFFTPTTIMWANDIGFDGIAAQARYQLFDGFTPFISGGLFPIYNTDLNFSSVQQPKIASYDKYLYAGQVGLDWKLNKDFAFKGSVGYYYFQNVQGQVSAPQVAYSSADQFSTDDSRPSFAQKGNTYMEIRNIQATADNSYGTQNQYQYFGLATPFQVFSANARLEYRHWEPFVVSLSGEWDQNMAWNANNIQNGGPPTSDNPWNITGPINNTGANGIYNGGNAAWIVQLKVGSGALQKRWDWDFGVSYRYVESDSVIDGFCDADFGLGGTNLKGFSVGGNLALSKNVFVGARWMNATGIAGPQFQSDILQIDINARF